jgi:rhodanese-related sulfurtransferase
LKEAVLLLVLAALLTAASWLVRDPRPAWTADPAVYQLELVAPALEVPEALLLFNEGVHLFIDTRPGDPGERPTVAGAFVIREAAFDDDLLALFDDLYPEDPVVVFGGGDMVGANNVAGRLLGRGFTDVQILKGGLSAWDRAGGLVGSAYLPEGFVVDVQEGGH